MRTTNSIRNVAVAVGIQGLNLILSFASRTLFIQILGAEYLGVNGLFSNILNVLSLMDLGVGSALIFAMYKPLADDDREKIRSLLALYAKMYRLIGSAVVVAGAALIPFLPYLIKGKTGLKDLNLIYILTLANTAISYFFSYKRSLLEADQKSYVNQINVFVFGFLKTVLQMAALALTRNFLLYLAIAILCTFLSNLLISRRVNRLYPYLKGETPPLPLDRGTSRMIRQKMAAGIMHKVGNIVITGTDNILISSFLSIYLVGIYSNYSMLTNLIYTTFGIAFSSITASVGNLSVTDDSRQSERVYNNLMLVNFWIYFFCTIALWVLVDPFIELWLGRAYLLGKPAVAVMLLNFYVSGMRHIPVTFLNASGLYYNSRYKPLAESAVNLTISLIALHFLGITGVFLGTLVSYFSASVWVEPYILYKHWFRRSPLGYFRKYAAYLLLMVITAGLTSALFQLTGGVSVVHFLFGALLCLLIPNAIFILIFRKTGEFRYLINTAAYYLNQAGILRNRLHRKFNSRKELTRTFSENLSSGESLAGNPYVEPIVKNGICCGCGACAGICCRIRMTEDRLGEYSPQFSGPCGGSGKCAEVCPMNADSRCSLTAFGEWGEKKEESIGQYADCYTVPAREEQKRENSAALAGLFRLLLSSGEADSVIYPARTEDPAKFYDYRICTDPDLLRACPGFFCFPLEISGVLRYIKNKPGKYAVAALPCGVKALRLAMMLDVVIAQRITYIIGISCLQNKSRGWLEYCSEQSRFGRNLISAELLRRASDSEEALYEYSFVYSDGSKRFVPFPKTAWKNRIHTLKGCGSCDDLFAEDADVTLIGDNPVFSIREEMLIVRSNRIQELVTAPESKMGLVKIEASALLEKTASQIAFDRASVFYRPERTRRRLAAFRSGNPPGFKTGLLETVRQRLAYSTGDRRRKKALRKLTRGEEISRVSCWQDGLLHFISRWQEHRNH